jgi:hypothetical protein
VSGVAEPEYWTDPAAVERHRVSPPRGGTKASFQNVPWPHLEGSTSTDVATVVTLPARGRGIGNAGDRFDDEADCPSTRATQLALDVEQNAGDAQARTHSTAASRSLSAPKSTSASVFGGVTCWSTFGVAPESWVSIRLTWACWKMPSGVGQPGAVGRDTALVRAAVPRRGRAHDGARGGTRRSDRSR